MTDNPDTREGISEFFYDIDEYVNPEQIVFFNTLTDNPKTHGGVYEYFYDIFEYNL